MADCHSHSMNQKLLDSAYFERGFEAGTGGTDAAFGQDRETTLVRNVEEPESYSQSITQVEVSPSVDSCQIFATGGDGATGNRITDDKLRRPMCLSLDEARIYTPTTGNHRRACGAEVTGLSFPEVSSSWTGRSKLSDDHVNISRLEIFLFRDAALEMYFKDSQSLLMVFRDKQRQRLGSRLSNIIIHYDSNPRRIPIGQANGIEEDARRLVEGGRPTVYPAALFAYDQRAAYGDAGSNDTAGIPPRVTALAFHEREYSHLDVVATGGSDGSISLWAWTTNGTSEGQKAVWEFPMMRTMKLHYQLHYLVLMCLLPCTHLPLGVTLAQGYSSSQQSGQITARNLAMAIYGGTGGAGGTANEQGGAGGTGQGPSIQIYTQSTILGQQLSDAAIPVDCPPPSRFFEGRKEVLLQLSQCFERTSHDEQIVALLHGLRGVGKTQIALKFIASSSQRFEKTFKITASSTETISAGYQGIAKAKQAGHTVNDAMTWLQSTKTEWLILFDNADNPELNLGDYMPHCQHGNILITSRNPTLAIHTGNATRSIQVQDMDEAAATALFHKISSVDQPKNAAYVGLLLKELHFFPLAIVQAAAYISQSPPMQQDMTKYMKLYEQNRQKVLSYKPQQRSWDYEATAFTTWQISFNQLSEPAQKFLQICSFLHFEGITEDIFELAAKYAYKGNLMSPRYDNITAVQKFLQHFQSKKNQWDSWVFGELLRDICSYSLLTQDIKGGLSMHPLVQEWVQLVAQDKIQMLSFTLWLIGMAVASRKDWSSALSLSLHVVHLDRDEFFLHEGLEEDIFHVYRKAGYFSRAVNMAENWRDKTMRINGVDAQETCEAMQCLGLAYNDMGRHADALHLENQVLQMYRQTLGEDHPETVLTMGNLSVIYGELGKHAEALKLGEQVLQICRQTLGEDHPDTILAMSNLAVTYSELGRHADALHLKDQVLEMYRRTLGEDHPETGLAKGNLARTYSELGRHADALELEEPLLEIRSQTLGKDHPKTVLTMGNLATTYSELGKHTEALRLREQVLEMYTQTPGKDHPDTIKAMGNLAVTYSRLGRHAEALKLKEQVLEIRRQTLGEDHSNTLLAMGNLAATYGELGKYAEALNLEEQVLEIRRQTLGEDHPDTLLAMGNLAVTYSELGRHADALHLKDQVLQMHRQSLGEDHPKTTLAMGNLARTYSAIGRHVDALILEEDVLKMETKHLGSDHSDTILAQYYLALTHLCLENWQQAHTNFQEVYEKQLLHLGQDHPHTIRTMSYLSQCEDQVAVVQSMHNPVTLPRKHFLPKKPLVLTMIDEEQGGLEEEKVHVLDNEVD
uniref:Nephrocystin-3 n=1 Tax=Mycena chlorophos TaxID=658473 RepID=A0ABQ0LFX9_MYCCL|nr:nephrocystin-3 [Mycena chlorophos]